MKETKVYVDDETLMKCERYRHNSCPIIQTHDRELVKKVCEKIKQDCWCGGAILEDNYYKVPVKYLQNLQKEFEDENNKN